MEQGQQEQLAVGERNKRLLIEKERETAETIRKRAMKRMGETRARENVEKEPKRRKCGGETVEYLREKKEQDKIVILETLRLTIEFKCSVIQHTLGILFMKSVYKMYTHCVHPVP